MRLYIGNLPFAIRTNEFREWLTLAGFTISEVSLVREHRTGKSRGFAFVEIKTHEILDQVRHRLDGKDLLGRRVVVGIAHPRRLRKRTQRNDQEWGAPQRKELLAS